jgi:hypothetical protein
MRGRFLLIGGLLVATAARAGDDDYAAMLRYLASSRIDGQALRGVNGMAAVNLSAGDLNQQTNLRAFTVGGSVQVHVGQQRSDNRATRPDVADASIGGQALAGGRGLTSINQASGSGNAQFNVVAAGLAAQGIRETTDGTLSAAVSASAGGQQADDAASAAGSSRRVAVEPTAMRGYQGVLQLNQAAGSGNGTGNQLVISLPGTPR